MLRRFRSSLAIAVVAVITTIAYGASASAFGIPDGDSATLVLILQQSIQSLATLNNQLGEMKKTYQSTKQLVSYAEDSRQAFDALVRFDVGKLEDMVETAVPNAGYFGREGRGGYRSWGQGQGELQLLLGSCVHDRSNELQHDARRPRSDGTAANAASQLAWDREHPRPIRMPEDPCETLQRRVSGQEVAANFNRMFGAPVHAPGTLHAAEAFASSDAQTIRNTARAQELQAMMQACRDKGQAKYEECLAAAASAQVATYRQMVEATDELATLNRTEAVRLAQETADRQRAIDEAKHRQDSLDDAARQVSAGGPQIQAPGFTFDSK